MRMEKWVPAAEVFASLIVAVTLIILIIEVRQNTLMQERQMQMERVSSIIEPYFASGELIKVLAKVKKVDGIEPVAQAFIDRYELTSEEAALWSRHVHAIWYTQQSHYLFGGPSDELADSIRNLLHYPDVKIVYELNEDSALSPDFIAYVESILQEGQPEL